MGGVKGLYMAGSVCGLTPVIRMCTHCHIWTLNIMKGDVVLMYLCTYVC